MSATFRPKPASAAGDSIAIPMTWLCTLSSGPPDVPSSIATLVRIVSLKLIVLPVFTGSLASVTRCIALT